MLGNWHSIFKKSNMYEAKSEVSLTILSSKKQADEVGLKIVDVYTCVWRPHLFQFNFLI